MRTRTAAILFGAAAAAGAAAIGATTAVLLGTCSADRVDRTYRAMAQAFITRPLYEDPGIEPQQPGRVVQLQALRRLPEGQ